MVGNKAISEKSCWPQPCFPHTPLFWGCHLHLQLGLHSRWIWRCWTPHLHVWFLAPRPMFRGWEAQIVDKAADLGWRTGVGRESAVPQVISALPLFSGGLGTGCTPAGKVQEPLCSQLEMERTSATVRPPRQRTQFQSLFLCWFIYKLLKMYKVNFGAGSGACASLLPDAWSDCLQTPARFPMSCFWCWILPYWTLLFLSWYKNWTFAGCGPILVSPSVQGASRDASHQNYW